MVNCFRFFYRGLKFFIGIVREKRMMNMIGVRKKMLEKGLDVVGFWRRRIWVRV